MRLERNVVVVDLVEKHAVCLIPRLDHVETPAAWLILRRGPRIGIDQPAKCGSRARFQAKIDDDRQSRSCAPLDDIGVAARHIFEMLAHGVFGTVGIARGDRLEDRAMRLVGAARPRPGASVVWRCSSSHSASAAWIAVKIGLRGIRAST